MSRNLKVDYINKIRAVEVPHGYKFDIVNYLYNPSVEYNYPSFVKKIAESEELETFRNFFYIKFWDGTGAYRVEEYTRKKDGDKWQVVQNRTEKTIKEANRFNLKTLLQLLY